MPKKKRSTPKTKHSSKKAKSLSRSALKLVDQAAGLLKQGIVVGAKQEARGRLIFKKKASSLLNATIKYLNQAIQEGSSSLRKGLKKI